MSRTIRFISKSKRRLTLVGVLVIALASVLGAVAYFTATGSGSATASTGTLANTAITTHTATGASVSLAWTAVTAPDDGVVDGYYVLRDGAETAVAGCGTAGSPTTNASCTDTAPASGDYSYTVVTVWHSWTSTSDPVSVHVVADVDAPTTTITFPGPGFHNAVDYNAGCLPTGICGTAGDTTGVAVVRVSVQRTATGPYWDGSGFNSVAEYFVDANLAFPGASSSDWNLPLALANLADSPYIVHVEAKDTIGNDSAPAYTSTRTFSIDTTPPTTADDTASIGNGWRNSDQTVTLSPSDGSGSGVAATYHTHDGSTPTASSATGTSVALNGDGVYTVRYFSIDNVANQENVETAGTQIRIDETNPAAPALGLAGAFVSGGTTYITSGQALTDAATDPTVNGASSGIASVTYYYCPGSCTPQPGQAGTTQIGSSSTGPSYSVPFTQPSDGTYTLLAQATDAAGNKGSSTVRSVAVDNTKPQTTDNSATIGNAWVKADQTVTLTPTDPVSGGVASGVAHTYYTSDGSTPTTSSTTGTSVALNGDGLYTVKYLSTDNVGNQEAANTAGTQIRIDKTNPSAGAIVTSGAFVSGSTYIKNGQALTDTTTSDPTVNAASSGVATVQYYRCSSGCSGTTPAGNPGLWTSIGTSSTAGSYSVIWNSQPADGSYSLIAGVTDNAGNTAYSALLPIVIDNAAPTTTAGVAPTPNASNWNKSDVTVTLTGNDGGGSGVASITYSESGAQSLGNTTYGSPFTINTEGTTTVTYHAVDNLDNAEGNKTATIKLDKTSPTVSIASITVGGTTTCEYVSGSSAWYSTTASGNSCGSATGSFAVAASASDPGATASGINDVLFPTLVGFTGGGDVLGAGPYASSYGWTNATSTSPSANVTASDNAGNTNTAPFSFTLDNGAPSGAITNPSAGNISGTVSLTSTSAADNVGGSGVKSLAYYRCSGVPASCTTSPPGIGWTAIGSAATTSPYTVSLDTTTVPNGAYTLKAVMTDNVGNQSTTAGIGVTVNNSYAFVLSSIGTQRAGTAFNGFTIQLQVNGSNTGSVGGTSYAGAHTITFGSTATGNSPNSSTASGLNQSLTFNASGQATAGSITLVKAEGSGSLSATDSTNAVTGTSNTFATDSGGVTLAFSPSGTVTFGMNQQKSFTVLVPNDAFGNPFTSAAGITVNLSLSSGSHWSFSATTTGVTSQALTITSGPAGNGFIVKENGNNNGATVILSGTVVSPFSLPANDTLTE
jgi:hypothetical protein